MNFNSRRINPLSRQRVGWHELSEIAFETAKEIVEEEYPDDANLFYWTRSLIKEQLLPRLEASHPRDWHLEDTSSIKGLAAVGRTERIPEIVGVSIVAEAVFRHISMLDYMPQQKEVTSITEDYAKRWSLVQEAVGSVNKHIWKKLQALSLESAAPSVESWVDIILHKLSDIESIPPQSPKCRLYMRSAPHALSNGHISFLLSNPGIFHLLVDHRLTTRRAYINGTIPKFQPNRGSSETLWSRPYFFLYVLAKNHGRPMTRDDIENEVGRLIKRRTAQPDLLFYQTIQQLSRTTKDKLKIIHKGAGYFINPRQPVGVLEDDEA